MKEYKIELTYEAAAFYEKVAGKAGVPVERVLADALFKLAGELALEAIHKLESM